MLEIVCVEKRYGPAGETPVLDGITLTVRAGELLCVVGESGCGKTTLLNIIAGFERVTGGVALVRGTAIKRGGPDRVMLFQNAESALFPWQSVKQNVEFGARLRGLPRSQCAEIGQKYLKLVGLEEHAEKYPAELSGGMLQRLQLARAFAVEPEILLMDEPFGALDALTRWRMHAELLAIWQRTATTIVFVTHDIAEAVALADRIAILTRGPCSRVKDLIAVELPRPRDRSDPEFGRLLARVQTLIEDEAPTDASLQRSVRRAIGGAP